MPRALIAGCGYLGRALAGALGADGWEIEGWTISAESARELAVAGHSARSVDISDKKTVAAHRSRFDAVIQSASTRGGDAEAYRRLYLNGARNLLAQLEGRRFLFISSTSVYAQNTGEWVSEKSPADPKHETGRILRQAENLVCEHKGIVVRLGGLYGPNRSALLRKFLAGEVKIDPERDRFMNQIHRDDAAAAIQFLLSRPEAAGQIYNLVDNEPSLLTECYRWLANKLNHPVASSVTSTTKRKRGDSNKRVSNAKLRALGWAPCYPSFAEGMDRSVLPTRIGGDP